MLLQHYRRDFLRGFALFVFMLMTRETVHAALLAYESFNYSAGQELSGLNGGTGFSDAWSTYTGSATIQAGSLNGAELETSGGKVFFNPTTANLNAFRTLQTPLNQTSGVSYLSFLGDLQSGQRFLGISLYNGASELRLIGKGGSASVPNWAITGASIANTTIPATTEALLVLRIDWNSASTETMRLWVYPSTGTLPTTEPTVGTANATLSVELTQITQLRIGAGFTNGTDTEANGWIDEIRVGTTWNDVVPVPEPSSLAILLSLSAIGGFAVFKKRRTI
jgi:hypothetical protein